MSPKLLRKRSSHTSKSRFDAGFVRRVAAHSAPAQAYTLLYLPGVHIQVHYGSCAVDHSAVSSPVSSLKRGMRPPTAAQAMHDAVGGAGVNAASTTTVVKRGNLYASITLQQLSEVRANVIIYIFLIVFHRWKGV